MEFVPTPLSHTPQMPLPDFCDGGDNLCYEDGDIMATPITTITTKTTSVKPTFIELKFEEKIPQGDRKLKFEFHMHTSSMVLFHLRVFPG